MNKPPFKQSFPLSALRPAADTGNADVTAAEMAHKVGANDMRLIVAIAQRGAVMAKAHRVSRSPSDQVIEPNPEIVQADILVTHYWRKLNLHAFLTANDLDFMSELATIFQHIKRPIVFFPASVMLRFAQTGATFHN